MFGGRTGGDAEPAAAAAAPDRNAAHVFQEARPVYLRTIHHPIFTTVCTLCGRERGHRFHLQAEQIDSLRWPL